MSFKIVNFIIDNSVEGVPSSWIKTVKGQTLCYWPIKINGTSLTNLIKALHPPKLTWSLLKCKIYFEANSYQEMREKCQEAVYLTSSENTEGESDANLVAVGESSSDEDIPQLPQEEKKDCP